MRRPRLEVLGRAAQEDGAVDGARAAHDPTPGDGDARPGRGAGRLEAPVERGELVDRLEPAVGEPDHIRCEAWVREVRAGLEQHHLARRVIREAGRKDTARGPAADDERVDACRHLSDPHVRQVARAAGSSSGPADRAAS